MLFDLFAIALLAVFATLGAIRGAMRSGVRLAIWILGYAGAVVAAPLLGPTVVSLVGVPPPLSMVLAGTAVLVSVWVAGGVVLWLATRSQDGPPDRSAADRSLGALFGGSQGALLVLLLGWLCLWLEAAERVGVSLPVPAPEGSVTAELTGQAVEMGLDAAVPSGAGPGTRVVVRVAGRPGESLERMQKLLENPRIVALRNDRVFWSYVRHDAIDAALNQGSFLGIAHDNTLRGELHAIGLIDEAAASDPRLFRDAVRDVLVEVGPRIQRIADSPEMRDLAGDPDVQTAVARGETAQLILHPGVRRLIGRVLADEDSADL